MSIPVPPAQDAPHGAQAQWTWDDDGEAPEGAGGALEAELQRRLWALFDAAKTICEVETPGAWAALYQAVADVPECRKP